MKKVIVGLLMSMTLLSGCAKVVNQETYEVPVVITGSNYTPSQMIPMYVDNNISYIIQPEETCIYIEYNGEQYISYDWQTYNKFVDDIGDEEIGVMQVTTYNNGTVKTKMIGLKEKD